MANRINLGLIFSHNEQWIGGSYYILNLISALKTLPNEKQPQIIILSNNENDFKIAQETKYPFLEFRNPFFYKRNLVEKIIDKIHKIIFGKYIIDKRITQKDVDVIFPASNDYPYEKIKHKIFWFADFQHKVLPQYFSEDEIANRNAFVQFISKSTNGLILSSEAAKKDWEGIAIEKNCKVYVLPFSVTHPSFERIHIRELLLEFNLNDNYFIVSNQFWAHKNHFLVLKAATILKQQNIQFQIVFTGKENDYRNENYFKSIKSYVKENNLNYNLKFLGLVERESQLVLMKNALAVIQPSLFEGWSTVIEDAKSLGCKIFVSDIDVHKEQLDEGAYFFASNSEDDLAQLMMNVHNLENKSYIVNYTKNIKEFGENFYKIMGNYKN